MLSTIAENVTADSDNVRLLENENARLRVENQQLRRQLMDFEYLESLNEMNELEKLRKSDKDRRSILLKFAHKFKMTGMEAAILTFLYRTGKGGIVEYDSCYRHLEEYRKQKRLNEKEDGVGENVLFRAYLSKIRKKLEGYDIHIESVRSIGVTLREGSYEVLAKIIQEL